MCNPICSELLPERRKLTRTIVNYCDSRYLIKQQAAAEETPKQQTILAVSSLSFLRLGAYTEVSLGEGGGGLK